VERQIKREAERQEREDQRSPAQIAVVARQQHQHQRADRRQEGDECENAGIVHLLTPSQIMKTMTPAPPMATQAAYERMLPDCIRRSSLPIPLEAPPAPLTRPSIMPWSTPRQKTTVESASSGLTKMAP